MQLRINTNKPIVKKDLANVDTLEVFDWFGVLTEPKQYYSEDISHLDLDSKLTRYKELFVQALGRTCRGEWKLTSEECIAMMKKERGIE